jgi:hypothetical protein
MPAPTDPPINEPEPPDEAGLVLPGGAAGEGGVPGGAPNPTKRCPR